MIKQHCILIFSTNKNRYVWYYVKWQNVRDKFTFSMFEIFYFIIDIFLSKQIF